MSVKKLAKQNVYTARKMLTFCDLPCKSGAFSKDEDIVYLALLGLGVSVPDMLAASGTRDEIQVRHKIRLFKTSKKFINQGKLIIYKQGFWSIEETESLRIELCKHPSTEIKHLISLPFGRELSQLIKTRSPLQCVAKVKHLYGLTKLPTTFSFNSLGLQDNPTQVVEAQSAAHITTSTIKWKSTDICLLETAVARYGITDFRQISSCFPGISAISCRKKWVPNRYQGSSHSTPKTGTFDEIETIILRGLLKVIPIGIHSSFNVFFPGRSFKQVYYNLNKLLSMEVPAVFEKFQASEILDLTDFYLHDGYDWSKFLPTLNSSVSIFDCQLVIAHLAARHLVKYIDSATHRAIKAKYKREKATSCIPHVPHRR
ncbi:hypothetical protein DSO57_1004724 [Entomophthora muscae]|uniref:Uncharacterized protein n=1 Tax=Entomophthora muscae TaxID=34485 RepID=A0ACC2TIT2_9FUNG|nr:hypothetical protein DSO57_1004724 [Entomophthora muscae]